MGRDQTAGQEPRPRGPRTRAQISIGPHGPSSPGDAAASERDTAPKRGRAPKGASRHPRLRHAGSGRGQGLRPDHSDALIIARGAATMHAPHHTEHTHECCASARWACRRMLRPPCTLIPRELTPAAPSMPAAASIAPPRRDPWCPLRLPPRVRVPTCTHPHRPPPQGAGRAPVQRRPRPARPPKRRRR